MRVDMTRVTSMARITQELAVAHHVVVARSHFEGETPPGGRRTNFLPRSLKDSYRHSYSFQCWSPPKNTISDSAFSRTVSGCRAQKPQVKMAGDHTGSDLSKRYPWGKDSISICSSSTLCYQGGALQEESRHSDRQGSRRVATSGSHSGSPEQLQCLSQRGVHRGQEREKQGVRQEIYSQSESEYSELPLWITGEPLQYSLSVIL